MTRPRICHITTHLGGGIGRALKHLTSNDDNFSHEVISLEETRTHRNIKQLRDSGVSVRLLDEIDNANHFFSTFDILQVEYWNSPRLHLSLSQLSKITARWVFWAHISGLNSPIIPRLLPTMATALVRSWDNVDAKDEYVTSSAGLKSVNMRAYQDRDVDALYVGTLSPAKLHSNFISYLDNFFKLGFDRAIVAGDITTDCTLNLKTGSHNLSGSLELPGFVQEIDSLYESARYFLYILNPDHYGSGENALIEAMSAGAVPIVLDNPVEASIVKSAKAGYIIKKPEDLVILRNRLLTEETWTHLSKNAVEYTQANHSGTQTALGFNCVYDKVLCKEKHPLPFNEIFGSQPHQWFLSGRADAKKWGQDCHIGTLVRRGDYAVVAETKGSLAHFSHLFPGDKILKGWFEKSRSLHHGA